MLYVILNEKGQYMSESRRGHFLGGGRAWATSSQSEAKDAAEWFVKFGVKAEVVNVEILNGD
jgi:hypothetical protein